MANRISSTSSPVRSTEAPSQHAEEGLRPDTQVRDVGIRTLDPANVPADHNDLKQILAGHEAQIKHLSQAQLEELHSNLSQASKNIQPGWTTAVRGLLGGDTRQKLLGTTLRRVGEAIQDKKDLKEALTAENLGASSNNKMKALMARGVRPTYGDVLTALKVAGSKSGVSQENMLQVLEEMAQKAQITPDQIEQLRGEVGGSVALLRSLNNIQGLNSAVDEQAIRQSIQKK